MLSTESLDELDVVWLVAVGSHDADMCLPLVETFGTLVQSTDETICGQGVLQDLLNSGVDVHLNRWHNWRWRGTSENSN